MLHFEVQEKRGERADYAPSVMKPSKYPSFVLVFNYDWHDSSYRTWFCLFYFDDACEVHKIGEFKLIKRGAKNTFDTLNKECDGSLGSEYCSLGITPEYYDKIYSLFDHVTIDNLLTDLCDCAYNPIILEKFDKEPGVKLSLLREDSSSQAIVEAPFLLSGKDKEAAYSFSLNFAPDYLKGAYTNWDVKLLYKAPLFMRTVGLIGENGVGKTQMLKTLVKFLISDSKTAQSHPLFRSCLTISSTPFDGYYNISTDITRCRIPYKCFSIEQNTKNTETQILSCINIIFNKPLIHNKKAIQTYKESVDVFLGENMGDFVYFDEKSEEYMLNKIRLHEVISILSSGQLHILNLMTFIYAHIHLSSILIIDEPEVHMHPQIIVFFMNMLGEILKKFRSFAVIATHSPLIVREMVSNNVYVMKTVQGNIPIVSKVPFETFGADTSELYSRIFQYDEKSSLFYNYVRTLTKNKIFPFEDALDHVREFAPNLSLNARLSIRDYIDE